MKDIPVNINPIMVNWLKGKAQKENADDSTIETIEKWVSGEERPTFNQIEDVSKKTNIPFGYFFLKHPPVESSTIELQINEKLKEDAETLFEKLGLDLETAIRIFLSVSLDRGGIPFEVVLYHTPFVDNDSKI